MIAWAQGEDPLIVASRTADALRARAESLGLGGPPVDVLGLVRSEAIVLRAANDVGDAQIEVVDSTSDSPLAISYNPSRPRGRLRFNIAHELAHAQFPDVREKLRQRTPLGAVAAGSDDDWELELLCNLIASDLLVPAEGMAGLTNSDTDIDFLMEQRRKWDVSTEAMLRRFVTLASRPIALVAASRISSTSVRVDYAHFASSVAVGDPLRGLAHGSTVQNAQALAAVVAVGQTARGPLAVGGHRFRAQAVGAPPYAGRRGSRVLALVEPELSRAHPLVEHVVADLLETDDANVIFMHVSSDSVRAWSRMGVGARLASRFPDLAQSYRMWTLSDPAHLDLGNVHLVGRTASDRSVAIATVVAQEGYGSKGQLRYDALARGLDAVRAEAERTSATVHVPRLGAGQAAGRWDRIEALLDEHLAARGIRVVVHTKPHERPSR